MRRTILCALAVSTAMSGCAAIQPYPTLFQKRDPLSPKVEVGPCDQPDNRAELRYCLKLRARAWERWAVDSRRTNSLTGALAIPLGATAIGLAAEHDPNHAVPVLGLLSGAGVTYASAYARGDISKIYETALGGYQCLISATNTPDVAYWNLAVQRDATKTAGDEALNALSRPVPSAPPTHAITIAGLKGDALATAQGLQKQISADLKAGNASVQAFQVQSAAQIPVLQASEHTLADTWNAAAARAGQAQSGLLKQADDIDRLARQALAGQIPTAAAVAASSTSALQAYQASYVSAVAPGATTPTGIGGAGASLSDAMRLGGLHIQGVEAEPAVDAKQTAAILAQLKAQAESASAFAKSAKDLVDTAGAKVQAFNAAQAVFQTAYNAYKPLDLQVDCSQSFGVPAAFTADPSPVIVTNTAGVASFEIKGGVFPQRFVRADGLTVHMTVIGPTVSHVEVSGFTGDGPWTAVFYDGSPNPAQLTVTLQKPPTTTPKS